MMLEFKNKKTLKKAKITTFIFYTFFFILLVGCKQSSTDWAFHFVVWNEDIYEIDKSVIVDVEKEIGTVKKYIENEGNYKGVFSNFVPKGTKLYKIKDINVNEAIAVELDGYYIEARNQGKYGE